MDCGERHLGNKLAFLQVEFPHDSFPLLALGGEFGFHLIQSTQKIMNHSRVFLVLPLQLRDAELMNRFAGLFCV